MDLTARYAAVRGRVVGREREMRLVLAALAAGRHLLLEGPPGTSKSTILRRLTEVEAIPFHLVEGNADLTPAKLIGHFSPAETLREGYRPEAFAHGPLPRAMREGGYLYLEEMNRVPEDTLNVLISAMAERELVIPRVGKVVAHEDFRVIAAMNPFDNIGTGRLSSALTDRLCRVTMDYQSEAEERAIVAREAAGVDDFLRKVAVRTARLSRGHEDLRAGASVRAAIDFALIGDRLAQLLEAGFVLGLRQQSAEATGHLVDAANAALAVKILVRQASKRKDEDIVAELARQALAEIASEENPGEAGGADGQGTGEGAPPPAGGGPPGMQGALGHRAGVTPPHSELAQGEVITGEEALRRTNQKAGDRMMHGVKAQYPQHAAALEDAEELSDLESVVEGEELPFDLLGELAQLHDRPELRALARRLALELVIREARRDEGRRTARGRLTRTRGGEGELDLDRTLEALLELPAGPASARDDDLWTIERRARPRSYALMLDISGSMKGAKVFHAALALAALALRAGDDPLAVIAFWRDAAVLQPIEGGKEPAALLGQLLALRGRGLTNLGLALEAGLDELARAPTEDRIGILFSDGLQTAGDPAAEVAAAYATLHVVGISGAPEAAQACEHLAQVGGGRCALLHELGGGVASIPEAINLCLA
ncbi:MAG: AAA family ATPase [Myxococcota bacterium]